MKTIFLCVFFNIINLLPAQDYISDYGFEQIAKSYNLEETKERVALKNYNNTSFKWFVIDEKEKNVQITSQHCDYSNYNPNYSEKNLRIATVITTPAYQGYGYANLKDNFSLHTKLEKSIRKGNKYRLDYFLNKSFMANSANKYFYISVLLNQKEPNAKKDNKTQLIQNRILHSDIKLNKALFYKFEKDRIDTIRVEPRPDLWQKFSIEFTAEDDFEFLGLVRDIKHPQGLTEFMYLDNVQLYLIEDNINEGQEQTKKINDLAKRVQFETGSSRLTNESEVVLDSLYFYIKNTQENSNLFVEISGYTDDEGESEKNLLLSRQRVEAVRLFFKNKNEEKELLPIITKGFGEAKPLTLNETKEEKAINRRVEIRLLNKDKATEIIFESLSYEEAKQKAKEENKLIFIDAYTSWCKPCKLMDRDVFTDSTVAKVFNESFINLKIDMESEMGKPLKETYKVQGYPTFLFIDFEGNLTYAKAGFMNAVELKNLGEEVIRMPKEKYEIQKNELEKRLYEKAKAEYEANRCKLDFTEAYFNLLKKDQKEEIKMVQSNYIKCLENSQDFSHRQVAFLLNNLVKSRNDVAYNFYLTNKSKFEKNYGDSLLVLESYLEETFFIQETDTLIKQIGEREKLIPQEIEEFEKIVTTYSTFSENVEKESREKEFERPIKSGIVDYVIYSTAIPFYSQHGKLNMFANYLVKYNQIEKLESYKDDFFGEITIPLTNFQTYVLYYLEQENKEIKVLKELSLIFNDLMNKNYLSNYTSYFTAARVFYCNKEKQEAQKMLEKAFELKDESFDEEKYNELKNRINKL